MANLDRVHGHIVEIDRAYLIGVKANFVKCEVRLTLSISLDVALPLREALSMITSVGDELKPLEVSLSAFQYRLPEPRAPGDGMVTLSTGDKSVTMTGEELERVAEMMLAHKED